MDPEVAAQRRVRVAAVFDRVADTYESVGVPVVRADRRAPGRAGVARARRAGPGPRHRAWLDLLSPGGRLAVSTFGPRDDAWEQLDDVFTPFLLPQLLDARTSGTRGPFANDAGVEELLAAAGFGDVRTTHVRQAVSFVGVEQWREWSWSHGQRTHWGAVPDDRRGDVMAAAAQRLATARDGAGRFTLGQDVRLTVGPWSSVA